MALVRATMFQQSPQGVAAWMRPLTLRTGGLALFGAPSVEPTPTAVILSSRNGIETATANKWHKRVICAESDSRESSPRAWLESRKDGAYTVIRCDYSNQRNDKECKIWGLDFHLERLCQSYHMFVQLTLNDSTDTFPTNALQTSIDGASRQTRLVLDDIVDAARSDLWDDTTEHPVDRIVMVTILWYPMYATALGHVGDIRVEAHATIGPAMQSDGSRHPFGWYEPRPISAVAAYGTIGAAAFPSRQPYPRAKLSAWCRQRRPLEEAFMEQQAIVVDEKTGSKHGLDVQEVILTATSNDTAILLEGLTSNLFVVYPCGVIRTAGTGVLAGWARHLVQQTIQEDNRWTLDTTTPIRLDEAGQWKEIFVTSAIRLIVPVQTLLVPVASRVELNGTTHREYQTAWTLDGNQPEKPPVWKRLYDLILSKTYRIDE